MKSYKPELPGPMRQYAVFPNSSTRIEVSPSARTIVVLSRAGHVLISSGEKEIIVPPGESVSVLVDPKVPAISASLLDAAGVGCAQVTEFYVV